MILDDSGVILTPGNSGNDCAGNGSYADIECCCDECDYLQCCLNKQQAIKCNICSDKNCPRAGSVP